MKIKRVESDQFAGVQGIDISFTDGINLVIGDNESGKSTIADLIYRILFKDAKLDGRSDSDFIERYFPKALEGPQGDVIDGTLIINTANGDFKLKKEWDKGFGDVRLTTPEKTVIKNQDEINRVLDEELGYREGVFDEIVFASQKRGQHAIESIMKELGKKKTDLTATREDLASTLTQAVLETGGVSLEKLENQLNQKEADLLSHWDWVNDAPQKNSQGRNHRWSKDVGAILKAYYEKEDVQKEQQEVVDAENKVEECQALIKNTKAMREALNDKKNKFNRYRSLLDQVTSLRLLIDSQDKEIKEKEGVLKQWPQKEKDLQDAISLKGLFQNATTIKKYNDVKEVKDKFDQCEKVKGALTEIKKTEVDAVSAFEKRKQRAEGKLAGLNLVANIKQLGELPIEVKTIVSGKAIEGQNDEFLITEAVSIVIPGVMEMVLTPKGVDVNSLKAEIQIAEEGMNRVFNTHGVKTSEELQDKYDTYNDAVAKSKDAYSKLELVLNRGTWEAIENEYEKLDDKSVSMDEVLEQIDSLCGEKSIDEYIGGVRTSVAEYIKKYGSIESLEEGIKRAKRDFDNNETKLADLGEVPIEYRDVADSDEYESSLNQSITDCENEINENLTPKLNNALIKLGERSAEEFSERLMELEDVFNEKKAEYAHWKNIKEVFLRMKNEVKGNPTEDIEESFRNYLSIITDGTLELKSMDDKLTTELASGKHKLTYDILSNGTKDTISLAFRLAMLDHLYPKGGGLAVFDDAFTEMDPKRVKQSCRLIEKFAENNQVIFITCDEKYKELLKTANTIELQAY